VDKKLYCIIAENLCKNSPLFYFPFFFLLLFVVIFLFLFSISFIVDFALQPKAIRQTYLKERIHAANNHKNEHRKQHRKKKVSSKSKGNPRYFCFSVFLGSVDLQNLHTSMLELVGLVLEELEDVGRQLFQLLSRSGFAW